MLPIVSAHVPAAVVLVFLDCHLLVSVVAAYQQFPALSTALAWATLPWCTLAVPQQAGPYYTKATLPFKQRTGEEQLIDGKLKGRFTKHSIQTLQVRGKLKCVVH